MLDILHLTPQNQEALLTFVRRRLGLLDGGDAMEARRYESIAGAFVAVEHGASDPFYHHVVAHWAAEYFKEKDAKQSAERQAIEAAARRPEPFAAARSGTVGNPRYQAYLDTLEEDELAKVNNNVGYFAWINEAERRSARDNCSIDDAIGAMRTERLSQRVRATLSKGG